MIVSFLQGGLGNQLFQVAASIGAAEWYGNEWRVQSDFPHEHFNIPQEKLIDSYGLPRYKEPNFFYEIIPSGDLQLFGYFQSLKYFKHCQKLIRHLYSCPYEEKIKWKYREILEQNTCAVHVRRGDYLKLSEFHYNLETEYFTNTIAQLAHLHSDMKFVCFSDDIAWCKENIKADYYIEDEVHTEFHLMSYCKNFIISNSTFSWWASYLSTNKDKLIIAPPKNKWFGEKNKHLIVHDLYCENWVY